MERVSLVYEIASTQRRAPKEWHREHRSCTPKPSGQEMGLYKAPKAIEMVDMGKDQVKCKLKADKEVKECSVHI